MSGEIIRQRPDGPSAPATWPNSQTAVVGLCIAINAVFETAQMTAQVTWGGNAPVRAWNSMKAFRRGDYATIAYHTLALSALLLPQGRFIAIGVDVVSECFRAYQSTRKGSGISQRTNRLDPSKKENALRILNLSPGEVNVQVIEAAYLRQSQALTAKKNQIPSASTIANELQLMIDDAAAAYQTLTREAHS